MKFKLFRKSSDLLLQKRDLLLGQVGILALLLPVNSHMPGDELVAPLRTVAAVSYDQIEIRHVLELVLGSWLSIEGAVAPLALPWAQESIFIRLVREHIGNFLDISIVLFACPDSEVFLGVVQNQRVIPFFTGCVDVEQRSITGDEALVEANPHWAAEFLYFQTWRIKDWSIRLPESLILLGWKRLHFLRLLTKSRIFLRSRRGIEFSLVSLEVRVDKVDVFHLLDLDSLSKSALSVWGLLQVNSPKLGVIVSIFDFVLLVSLIQDC